MRNLPHPIQLLLFLLFSGCLCAQSLPGRVADARTGEPVAGAMIYADHSQVRTVSDSAGRFRLQRMPPGTVLYITHLSYEKTTVQIQGDSVRAWLQPREQELSTVTVTTKARDSWKKWGAVFTEYFIGSGDAARSCRLLNPEVLVFHYNEAAGLLSARARAPLQLENRLLGYQVHIDLDYFRFSFANGTFEYAASSFYEPLAAADERERQTMAAQRLLAWGGSRQHFARALYRGELEKEGFHLFAFQARPNTERSRVEARLLRERARQNQHAPGTVSDNDLLFTGMSRDSARYYSRILGQPAYWFEDTLPVALTPRWRTLPEGRAFLLPDSLLLQYEPGPALRAVARKLGKGARWAAQNTSYTFLQNQDAGSRYALLYLAGDSLLRVEPSGELRNNGAFYSEGYLSGRRMAFALPQDYDPASDEARLLGPESPPTGEERLAVRLDSTLAAIAGRSEQSEVFLHLDKNRYEPNENIWFSAYLLLSACPPDRHRTLQVLLVQKDRHRLVLDERFVLQQGRGAGYLFLPDTLPAGSYELVAYTDAQAAETDHPAFRQEIQLIAASAGYRQRYDGSDDERQGDSIRLTTRIYTDKKAYAEGAKVRFELSNDSAVLAKGTATVASGGLLRLPSLPLAMLRSRRLHLRSTVLTRTGSAELYTELTVREPAARLRWYPEGGSLVNGLPARLVFECRDQAGAPVALSAALYDNDSLLATLRADGTGFGSIGIQPRLGHRYRVQALGGAVLAADAFPAIDEEGISLQVPKGVVRDTVEIQVWGAAGKKAYLLLHDFRQAYLSRRIELHPSGDYFQLPVGSLPAGPATLTLFDGEGRPLAERTLLREDTAAAAIELTADSAIYGTRQKVTLRIRARNPDGSPVPADMSLCCVRQSRVAIERYQNIVPFARWQRYAALQQWPLRVPSFSLAGAAATERFLLTNCWTRYHWQQLAKQENVPATPFRMAWNGQVTYQGYPLKKPVTVFIQGSDSIRTVQTDPSGFFSLDAGAVTTEPDWLLQAIVNRPDKHLYDITFSTGDEDLRHAQVNAVFPGFLQPGQAEPEFSENERGKELATVVVKGKQAAGIYRSQGDVIACGDYVCMYHILNCYNHPLGAVPQLNRVYKLRVGAVLKDVVYRGCGRFEDPNGVDSATFHALLHRFRGRYYTKDFYEADYSRFSPEAPETLTTLCWKPQLLLDAAGDLTITFYTNDLEGSFLILANGLGNGKPLQGFSTIEVHRPMGQ